MSPIDTKTASINELVDAYAIAARLHSGASNKGDHITANTQHDLLATIYRELRVRGVQAQRSLLPLLESADAGVKIWAAAHALEFAPNEGELILETLSQSSGIGILPFTAQMTLKVWRKGALKFP